MTDRLEELLEQAETEDGAGAGLELFARSLLWERPEGAFPGDRQQVVPAQTTGQGEELTGERIGGAVSPMGQVLPGRTLPETAAGKAIWLAGAGEAAWQRAARRQSADDAAGAENAPAADGGGSLDRAAPVSGGEAWAVQTDGVVQADILWQREWRQTAAEGLYQRLVRAGWERSGSQRAERTVVVEQQSVGTPSLTVDQLDRAVRRDSRRYDGGMELY